MFKAWYGPGAAKLFPNGLNSSGFFGLDPSGFAPKTVPSTPSATPTFSSSAGATSIANAPQRSNLLADAAGQGRSDILNNRKTLLGVN